MRLALALTALTILLPAQNTDTVYGRPSDLKGLKKVFVDAGGDLKNRERVMKEIEKAKLDLTLLDSAEGAEIILNFGGGSESRVGQVVTSPSGTVSTPLYRKIPTGQGVAYVVKGDKLAVVMSFEDEQTTGWERKPATNFGRDFVKLYKKANGLK